MMRRRVGRGGGGGEEQRIVWYCRRAHGLSTISIVVVGVVVDGSVVEKGWMFE